MSLVLISAPAWSWQEAATQIDEAVREYPERGERRRPGREEPQRAIPPVDPARVAPIPYDADAEQVPVPDRWRIMETLGLRNPWYDPYNQNTLKADKPIHGDWFLNLLAISDTVIEPRSIPTPVGPQSSENPDSLDVFGSNDQFIFAQNIIVGAVYYKGSTVFKPPDHEFRLTLALNYNRLEVDERRFVNIDPRDGTDRNDTWVGVQELFYDKHLRNVSDRYDFDSVRVGIQPFSTDFRGFLFQDNQFGVRLFGNRDNNKYQYNLAWFRRIEKDTNSGLNDVTQGFRNDDIFVANLYRQDWPTLGFFTQGTVVYNRNREDGFYFDDNGFLARPASLGTELPREYDVVYLGLNGDGHFDRVNVTASGYLALGSQTSSTFTNRESSIRAGFFATEVSVDFDWTRLRLSGLYASGDDDPFDDKSTGFDAIFENPIFAGADTSYFIRQTVPLVAGGGVILSGRNALLPSLRSSKELGQSNFDNPGLALLGVGADFDLTPSTRLSFNVNQLWFDDTSTLEVARNQGFIDKDIGIDASLALIWRPLMTQNIVARLSAAQLFPGEGSKALFGDDNQYSVLANIILSY